MMQWAHQHQPSDVFGIAIIVFISQYLINNVSPPSACSENQPATLSLTVAQGVRYLYPFPILATTLSHGPISLDFFPPLLSQSPFQTAMP